MTKKTRTLLCGYKFDRRDPMASLTKDERKVIRNFSQFLRGKGQRCPECLHKADKHEVGCMAKGCDCQMDIPEVLVARRKEEAPNWKGDWVER